MLLGIYDEVLLGFENDFCTVLVMIDMSAAFDTVDIDKLLNILSSDLNVRGPAFAWFKSFLKGRSQCVKVENTFSNSIDSKYGVPPGSTLGPILYNIYSKALSDVFIKCGFNTSSYADDSNGRLQFMINMQYSSICVNIPYLLGEVQTFMNSHQLKMNKQKTEILLFHPKGMTGHVIKGLFLNNECVRMSNDCRYLGFYLDSTLCLDKQVNDVISSCTLKIRKIRRIRHLMNSKDTETFVRSVIFSKINYCNSLFLNLSSSNLNKLQKLQNNAVRLIFNDPPRSSVTDKYRELEILRVDQTVVFKVVVLVHKIFNKKISTEIKDLVDIQDENNRLLEIKYFSSAYARKSFSFSAPRYWNKLATHIRQLDSTDTFKRLSKIAILENENNIMSATTGYYFLPR